MTTNNLEIMDEYMEMSEECFEEDDCLECEEEEGCENEPLWDDDDYQAWKDDRTLDERYGWDGHC